MLNLPLAICRWQTQLPHLWQPASSEVAKMYATPYLSTEDAAESPGMISGL